MYGNLYIEMKKAKIKQYTIASSLGLTRECVSQKVTGKRDFTSTEMFAIQKEYFPNLSLEYLFAKSE